MRSTTSSGPPTRTIPRSSASRPRPTTSSAARPKPTPPGNAPRTLEKGAVSSAPIGAPLEGTAPARPAGRVPAVAPLLESAEKALAAGDYGAAASFARQASEADPRNAEAHRLLGDAALAGGQPAEAEREFTAAIVLEPGNAKAVFGLGGPGRAAEEVEHRGEPLSPRRSTSIPTTSPPPAGSAARSASSATRAPRASPSGGPSRSIPPRPTPATTSASSSSGRTRSTGDRGAHRGVRLDGARASYHENLGRAFRKKSMWKESERELADAARLAPNDAGVWTALGQVRAAQNRLDEAATAIPRRCRSNPPTKRRQRPSAECSPRPASSPRPKPLSRGRSRRTPSRRRSGTTSAWPGPARQLRRRAEAFQKALSLDGSFDAARVNLARATELAALEKAAS